eukprot:m.14059 g.14059  ORF g.14059 m.14059 type:complete len:1345 (-) comp4744_c0_seq1:49-4083(-)
MRRRLSAVAPPPPQLALRIALVLALWPLPASPTTHVAPTELAALRQLFSALGGAAWGRCKEWGVGDPCDGPPLDPGDAAAVGLQDSGGSGWGGCVVCDASNVTVLGLFLGQSNLTGVLPPEICNLPALQSLEMTGNAVSGEIPPCLATLTSLTFVDLSNNQLTGLLPARLGERANTLVWLDLSSNRLSGGLSPLCDLVWLEYLSLSGNGFSGGVPSCIGSWHRLIWLLLGENLLTGDIPPSICRSLALSVVNIQENRLTGALPLCIGDLARSLSVLMLGTNQLAGTIPESMCQLRNLTALGLAGNRLTGPIPSCFGQIGPALATLNLQGNDLSGEIPASLCNCTALDVLILAGNALIGAIPPCFDRALAPSLLSVSLQGNALTGPMPSLCGSTTLDYIDFTGNPFDPGPIPECLCTSALTSLLLRDTGRTGQLHPCLFESSLRLTRLDLGENIGLVGSIPTTLCTATALIHLNLEQTGLSGPIPPCAQLPNLAEVQLGGVAFSGPLPPWPFASPGLQVLVMSGASLAGGFPADIDFSRVVNFNDSLGITTFATTGHPLGRLRFLGLVGCGLSGPLPQWLGSAGLPSLTSLALGGNAFTGELPVFAEGSRLRQLTAPNNQLSGTLDGLQHATLLTSLDVSTNSITGTVPQWLADRSGGMATLAVNDNLLSCDLPGTTAIAPGGALRLLSGNVFGNPVLPRAVEAADPGAQSYSGGSAAFTGTAVAFAAALLLSMLLVGAIRSGWAPGVPALPPAVDQGSRVYRLQQLIGTVLGVATLASLVALLSAYVTSRSRLTCRYGWVVTVAYLESYNATTGDGGWAIAAMVTAVLGGGLLAAAVVIGHRADLVHVGSGHPLSRNVGNPQSNSSAFSTATDAQPIQPTALLTNSAALPSGETRSGGTFVVLAVLACAVVLVLGVTVGVNVAFVVLQESSLSAAAKTTLLVLFSVVHDVFNHGVTPMAVTTLARRVKTANAQFALSTALTIAVTNSVVAPMVALLLVSEGCYREHLFSAPPRVQSSVALAACTGFVQNGTGAYCTSFGANTTIETAYTETFVFSGARCLSSITTLYTPEYLVIFALRLLLYPLAWWMAEVGSPWLLAGTRPAQRHFDAFFARRSRLLRLRSCRFPASSSTAWESDGDASESKSGLPTSDAPSDRTFTNRKAKGADAEALQVLHSAEPVVQAFNLATIGLCFGLLSPVLSAAALLLLAYAAGISHVLGDPGALRIAAQTPGTQHPEDMEGTHGTPPHLDPKLSVWSIAMLLAVQSLYVGVLLAVGEFQLGGVAAVVINWLLLGLACWASGRGSARPGLPSPNRTPQAKRVTWVTEGGSGLSEPLIPAESNETPL